MGVLGWLEATRIGTWVRESSSIFAYAGILFLHTLGLGIVVGLSTAVSLVILTRPAGRSLVPLRDFFPFFWAGFWINAASGVLLLLADATTKMTNPVFYVKLTFILFGVLNMRKIDALLAAEATSPRLRRYAIFALVLWAGAVAAGRLMAYLGPVSGAPGLSN